MALDAIDLTPMRPGWGIVYQSGVLASEELMGSDFPDNGLIVSMSGNENFRGPCLWIDMKDNDTTILADPVLFALVEAVLSFLKCGINVLIHCNEGKYRSTYLDVAVHIRGAAMTYREAFTLVKERHPIAGLRKGTFTQLDRMELTLKGAN